MMAELAAERNRRAFLKLVRYCEFGRLDNQDYRTLYNFEKFADTSTHPNRVYIVGKHKDGTAITSSPAGAYQIVFRTYQAAVDAGVITDFTPTSQDRIAIWLIQKRGAIHDVDTGKVDDAISKLTHEWVSLPGGSHPKIGLAAARSRFQEYLSGDSSKQR